MIAPDAPKRRLVPVALAFFGLGMAAILSLRLPASAVEPASGAIILGWGVLGMVLSFDMRPAPEWRIALAGFTVLALIAGILVAVPGIGIEALLLLAIFGLLCEGVFTILYAARLQAGNGRGFWLVFSGATALVLGIAVLLVWPDSATRLLDAVLCVDFLTTGLALLLIARATLRLQP